MVDRNGGLRYAGVTRTGTCVTGNGLRGQSPAAFAERCFRNGWTSLRIMDGEEQVGGVAIDCSIPRGRVGRRIWWGDRRIWRGET